jgi:hypothetical protein
MSFHLGDGLLALDRNCKSCTLAQGFHPHHLAFSHETDGAAGPRGSHVHRQTHSGSRRDSIASFQEQAPDAHILAGGVEFPDYPFGWKTQADWKPEVESDVPSLSLILMRPRGIVGLMHIPDASSR